MVAEIRSLTPPGDEEPSRCGRLLVIQKAADFERAGIAPDAAGRIADLHALRTTLGTNRVEYRILYQIEDRKLLVLVVTRQRSKGSGTLFKRGGRGPWVACWYDHDGARKERSTRTTDRAAADSILGKHVADAALRRDGVIDANDDRFAREGPRSDPSAAHDASDARPGKGLPARGHQPHGRVRLQRPLGLFGGRRHR